MKKKNTFIAMCASLALFLGACGGGGSEDQSSSGSSSEDKVLEMGTSADFAPFESRNPQGDFIGFDIDLANHIADELGYELKINDMKFDGLIGALQNNRVDMVLSGMSATEERKKNVDFSIEYNHSGEIFITKKDSPIKSLEDLEGKTLGVQLGSIQEEGANQIKTDEGINFEIKALDESGALIQELLSNRVDAVYMDKAAGLGYTEAQDLAHFDDPTTSSPGMAVAFPKGSELVDDVNKVLEEAEASGKLQELKDKWLSEELTD
ncbi:polar amino acid transport system substrate-binding protein [Planomicrobium soli]|uniref:Polar amino acid transport system substrate-binding protein n=1 Tax=Planomicrobium soli TaxID=1176648 RepID=A0A2P8GCR1_9BACL|nr:transporter substrate-binding domain-containing protein [Planomicrobium soli]PSL31665.1 polar amino acid transport system substrate-binding protein [Planomicrobium soli]